MEDYSPNGHTPFMRHGVPSYSLVSEKSQPDLIPPNPLIHRFKHRILPLLAALTIFGLLTFFLHPNNNPPIPENTSDTAIDSDYTFVIAQNGAVAAQNVRCSRIGVQIMREGGNAVDAAIAAAFCIGVVNMFSAGIGGGGFMTIRIPPKTPGGQSEVWNVDFRETAYTGAHRNMFVSDPSLAQRGGMAVGVPGELRGFREAHRRWGRLAWNRIVQPSVDLARGWTVDRELERWLHDPDFRQLILGNPDWREIFAPQGRILHFGETVRRATFANTLAAIAAGQDNLFYEGWIADSLINKIRSTGGQMTQADLRNYRVRVARALAGTYRDRKVYTADAPSSGPALLHMLNLLEHFDLGSLRTGLNVHRTVEAQKWTRIGDPGFSENDTARIAEISSKAFAARIVPRLTDDRTHSPEWYDPLFDVKGTNGTSHVSAVDRDRMAVSLTHTINLVFGSQVLDPYTGIILNNQMDDFSIPGVPNAFGLWPSPYNFPAPGKRPLSSTVPTILEHADGSFYLSVGGVGGSYIFGAVFQVILNLDWKMEVDKAIDAGRVQNQLFPLYTFVENTLPSEFITALYQRGHNISIYDPTVGPLSDVQAIVQRGRGISTLTAASDWRTNGGAAGY
ncbi:gamma-glutamyltranspeptidase [Hygrophoropsis aurantiaca]|uniref:Gamma-glutamyltranspeptidase n=1 Tax=Hygrophoropsis aurantiaca TaxID=72124 RepID=A0ACB8A0A3_9AGAM|nr:gamma-glutamyltranspeptidase [Hygrophoropsis aurantiaca]